MRKVLINIFLFLGFVSCSYSQERHFFGIMKNNQSVYEGKTHKFRLFSNNYFHGFDGCDIFVDNLFINEFDSHDINAIFMIEPSFSYEFENIINDLPIDRAVLQISFICNDCTVSLKVNQITLRDSIFNEWEDDNVKINLDRLIKSVNCKVLLKNSNRLLFSCGLLFVKQKEEGKRKQPMSDNLQNDTSSDYSLTIFIIVLIVVIFLFLIYIFLK